MGELINLNPSKAITDADIPAAIARDTETTAAVSAHAAAADPHPIYLTQAEGDGRYLASEQSISVRFSRFAGTTDSVTGNASFLHNLNANKILQIGGRIGLDGFPPAYMAAAFGGSCEWNLFHTATQIYIVCGPNKNSLINQPYKIVVIHEA